MRTMLRSKVTLLFMTLGLLIAVPAVALAQDAADPTGTPPPAPPAPTIQSDKEDYPPADTVILTGSGWQPGESVNINVNDDEGQTWNRNVDVIADENGGVRDEFVLPDWFVATYGVTATGSSGTIATSTFTDAVLPARGCPTGSPIVVDTTGDQFDNPSATNECSLREAISAANGDNIVDTITLPAGSYTLTRTGSGEDNNSTGDLDLTRQLTINGAGATTTNIQASTTPGNGIDRVLHFQASGNTGPSALSGVTVRHGQINDDGGGIKTDRSLTLTDVAITENDATTDATTGKKSGGGIFLQADNSNFTSEQLTLNRVTISGNTASLDGGGLRSTATSGATLTDVAITDNQAGNGGGISYQGNSLTHNGGTISGNTASLDGGGLHSTSGSARLTDVAITDNQAGNGGGISHQGSQLLIIRGTISGNTASLDGGGLYSFATTSGSGSLSNVTITNNSATGNGGGLRAAGANPNLALPNLSLRHATVSHNSAPNGSNISRSTGPVSLRNTIVSDGSGGANCAGVVINTVANLDSGTSCGFGTANTSKSNAEANLGDLANNGGPTETRALLSGSAAIDAGNAFNGDPVDQRNLPRPKDGDGNGTALHDIGAYELQAPITPDNTAPVANDDAATTDEDIATAIEVKDNDTDADNDSLSVVASSPSDPANGTVALITSGADAGKVLYTPDPNYNNTGGPNVDTFTYKVSDGTAESNAATVRVPVNPDNDAPVANDDTETMDEDGAPISIDFGALVSDIETSDANLTYNISDPGSAKGSLGGTGTMRTFDTANDFNGSVAIDYTVTDRGDPDNCGAASSSCDAAKTSAQKTVTITVNPVNDAPSLPGVPGLASDSSSPNQGAFTLNWTASTDVDSNSLTYELQHKQTNGTYAPVQGAGNLDSASYSFGGSNPDEDEGIWTYRVKASDGSLSSDFSADSSGIKVDTSKPNAPLASAGTADYTDQNGDKWYKGSATVTFTENGDPPLADGSDGSGVGSVSDPVSRNTSGVLGYSGTATDKAGNESEATSGSVNVDADAPTSSASAKDFDDNDYNSGNWTNKNVTVTLSADDGQGSGVKHIAYSVNGGQPETAAGSSKQITVSDEGTTTITFHAVDNVGKDETQEHTFTVKLDKTAPNVQCGSADGAWQANDVSIACTASDGGSDLANSGDAIFNLTTNVDDGSEDSNASTGSRTVSDNAGNSATAGPISGNKIDRKAPSFNCDSADTDWHATNQTFNCTANDGGSGLTPTSDANFSLSTTVDADNETSNASTGAKDLTDAVGNTVKAPAITGVKVDRKAPVLTDDGPTPTNPNGANNWYTSAVTNKFTATDGGSGFAPNGDLTKSFTNSSSTNEGNAVKIASGEVSDTVGNLAASIDSTAFKIDLSDPNNVTFQGGPAVDDSYDFGDTPAKPTCTADDAVSGFASCDVTGYSTAVGAHTMTATAKDNAGRTATATRSYTVKAWTFKGFYQPVDMNGTLNTVKGGSTVPIKFELLKGTTELTDTANVKQPLQAQKVNCTSGTGVEDPIELTATGGTSLRYDSTGGQYIYNWKTPTGAGSCYKVTITALDGSSQTALFKLK